ncbi:hypothetical protein FRAHR75_200077 [Frankia sp. Hr75.2]|nr:hypothetical protein FRAHR75_200077 [Frankia sp. Hr75.2]
MEHDPDPGLGRHRPEPVEVGVRGGAAADRPGAQVHQARVGVQHPLQLGHGVVDVEQGEHRNGEDPVLLGVAPVLLEPPVERAQAGVGQFDVVRHVLLDGHAEGGQHDGRLDTLVVHQVQPRGPLDERGVVLRVQDLAVGEAVRHLADEQALQRAGGGRVVPGHHAHEGAAVAQIDPAQAVGPALDPYGALLETGLDMPGEAVVGLVVVAIGIDQLVVHRVPPPGKRFSEYSLRRSKCRDLRAVRWLATRCGSSPGAGQATRRIVVVTWLPPPPVAVLSPATVSCRSAACRADRGPVHTASVLVSEHTLFPYRAQGRLRWQAECPPSRRRAISFSPVTRGTPPRQFSGIYGGAAPKGG